MPNQDQDTASLPVQPVGTSSKEIDMPRSSEPYIQEVPEYEVPKEVASHVAKVQEYIEVPPDLKNIGVQVPHSHGTVSDALQNNLKLPMTDDEIGARRKGDPKYSGTWLANGYDKVLKQADIYLKEIGKHFVRVLKPNK